MTNLPDVNASAVERACECLSRMRMEHAANRDGWNSKPYSWEYFRRSSFFEPSDDLNVDTTLLMIGVGMEALRRFAAPAEFCAVSVPDRGRLGMFWVLESESGAGK